MFTTLQNFLAQDIVVLFLLDSTICVSYIHKFIVADKVFLLYLYTKMKYLNIAVGTVVLSDLGPK